MIERGASASKRTPSAASGFPANLPQTPSDYLDILRFRWPWMVAATILGAVASQVAVRFVPKQYVSQTVVLVESEKIPKNFIPQLTTEGAGDRLRTIHEEILARPRVERILDELNPYPEMIDVPKADIVDMIRRRTVIELRGRDAFVVKYADTDPERAQRLATRISSMFIEETSGDRARQVQGANEFIDSQLVETKLELEKVEGSLRLIKQRYMGMLPNQLEANLSTLQRLELERQSVSDQIRAAKERRALLERQRSLQAQMNEPEAQLIPDVLTASPEPAAPGPAASLSALKDYLAKLRTRYKEQHPEVVATKRRIERLEAEVQAEAASAPAPETEADEPPAPEPAPEARAAAKDDFLVNDLTAQVASADRDIENLEARLTEVQGQIGRYQTRVEKIPEVEQELQSLERDYEMISKYYSELLSRKLEAETAGAVEKKWQEEQFKILDPAQIPESADFPQPSAFLMVGTLIGFGAGLALGFFLDIMDPTVKNLREMESLLPYPVLLTLPQVKERRKLLRQRRRAEPIPPAPTSTEETTELDAAS
jgi:polysaccharide chain length determinant protein (PEP-CTERM system associated)